MIWFRKKLQSSYLKKQKELGSSEIRTRVAGFKVLSANHYTIEPHAPPIARLFVMTVARKTAITPSWRLHRKLRDCSTRKPET